MILLMLIFISELTFNFNHILYCLLSLQNEMSVDQARAMQFYCASKYAETMNSFPRFDHENDTEYFFSVVSDVSILFTFNA